jgi:UDP-N-acetylglucosamine--N-acetylmuramyl-(pentapeptide) pyrophosphoryl-undecaprenol N-acetylglucosamine transferase
MPNIAIISDLRAVLDFTELSILYLGDRHGMGAKLIEPYDVVYKGIFCGKLRRYFSWQNFIDIFKMPIGIFQSFFALIKFSPQVVFCKGGYVSFPVAVAGWIAHIPVILHESDVVPGLANKLSARFASKICVSFEETKKYFPAKKVIVTGNPVRREIVCGNKEDGKSFTGLKEDLPVILVIGGSQGSGIINEVVFDSLSELIKHYQIVHICGEKNIDRGITVGEVLDIEDEKLSGRYRPFGFVRAELKHLYAMADLIVSRAGANSLAEIDVIGKPSLLIPLSKKASRGDQIVNSEVFAASHKSAVINEEDLNVQSFLSAIKKLGIHISRTCKQKPFQANDKIVELLRSLA